MIPILYITYQEVFLMNPFLLAFVIVAGGFGGLVTLYLTISFPAVIIWKIYRRIVKKIPMMK